LPHLLEHQRQVTIEAATGDWLRQVAIGIHVAADRICAGGVGPVAGGGLLRGMVVYEDGLWFHLLLFLLLDSALVQILVSLLIDF
jgi:hypothetical protein